MDNRTGPPPVLIIISLFLSAFCLSAAAQEVRVVHEPEIDFSAYHTFAWKKGTPAENPSVHERMVRAVEKALTDAGLTRSDEGPDLLVSVHARTGENSPAGIRNSGRGVDAWGGWQGWGSPMATDRQEPAGAIVVDLADAGTGKTVWRGTAGDVLSGRDEETERQVDKAVRKMFRKYPPKNKKKKP